jgi:hypothetical protein
VTVDQQTGSCVSLRQNQVARLTCLVGLGRSPVSDIQSVWFVELVWVTVCGAYRHEDDLVCRDGHVTDPHGFGGITQRAGTDRPLVAQEFLDRIRQQGGISPQQPDLVGIGEEGENAVTDQLGRSLVSL